MRGYSKDGLPAAYTRQGAQAEPQNQPRDYGKVVNRRPVRVIEIGSLKPSLATVPAPTINETLTLWQSFTSTGPISAFEFIDRTCSSRSIAAATDYRENIIALVKSGRLVPAGIAEYGQYAGCKLYAVAEGAGN